MRACERCGEIRLEKVAGVSEETAMELVEKLPESENVYSYVLTDESAKRGIGKGKKGARGPDFSGQGWGCNFGGRFTS